MSVNESIEDVEASSAEIARLVAARRIDEGTLAKPVVPCAEFLVHPVIVESLGADECAEILPLKIEVGRDLDGCGVRIPLVGIDVAVIVVEPYSGTVSGGATSIRLRNVRTILLGGPKSSADRNQIVDLEIGFAEIKLDGEAAFEATIIAAAVILPKNNFWTVLVFMERSSSILDGFTNFAAGSGGGAERIPTGPPGQSASLKR